MMYVPAYRPGFIEAAACSQVPTIILCLEDGTPDHRKRDARFLASHGIGFLRQFGKTVTVRVNAPDSGFLPRDLDIIVPSEPDNLRLPKISGVKELRDIVARVDELRTPGGNAPNFELMVETISCAQNLEDIIAPFAKRITAITVGGEDLRLDFEKSGKAQSRFASYSQTLDHVISVSGKFGKPAYDTTYMDLSSAENFKASCEDSLAQGFSNRSIIHPAQYPIASGVYHN